MDIGVLKETYAGETEMNIGDPIKAGFDPERLDRLTGWMQRYVDAGKIPFGHVVVSRDGAAIFESHVGMADKEAQRPLEDDAIVRLYSMTKPYTSVAAMMLVEEGKVHLTERLQRRQLDDRDRMGMGSVQGAGIQNQRFSLAFFTGDVRVAVTHQVVKSAFDRATVARMASMSAFEGVWPPLSLSNSSRR